MVESIRPKPCWKTAAGYSHAHRVDRLAITPFHVFSAGGGEIRAWKLRGGSGDLASSAPGSTASDPDSPAGTGMEESKSALMKQAQTSSSAGGQGVVSAMYGTKGDSLAGSLLWRSGAMDRHTDLGPGSVSGLVCVDHTLLVSCGRDGAVKGWDPRIGALLWHNETVHDAPVTVCVLAPRCRNLWASTGIDDSTNNAVVTSCENGRVVAWCRDGRVAWEVALETSIHRYFQGERVQHNGSRNRAVHQDIAWDPSASLLGMPLGASVRHIDVPAGSVQMPEALENGHVVCAARLSGTKFLLLGMTSGAVVIVNADDGTCAGVAWPAPTISSDDAATVAVAASDNARVGVGGVVELHTDGIRAVAQFGSSGLFSWRVDVNDSACVLRGQSGFLASAELGATRFSHILLHGALVYACSSTGSVLCIDAEREVRFWHTEQAFVDCSGLHMTGDQLFAGTDTGIVAVNVGRLATMGLACVYNHEVSRALLLQRCSA